MELALAEVVALDDLVVLLDLPLSVISITDGE
jgi:hypothetical protein